MSTATATLDQFAAALAEVATIGAAIETEAATLAGQEADVLTSLIASLKPVMRYIDRPVRASFYVAGNQFAHAQYTYMDEQGIELAGDGPEQDRSSGDQNRGDYDGTDLVLGRSGQLYHRTFTGSWSRWHNESESWTTTANAPGEYGDVDYDCAGYEPREGSTAEVTPLEALTHYSLDDIVSGIMMSINNAIKASQSKQRTLASRLERLSAVKAALNS